MTNSKSTADRGYAAPLPPEVAEAYRAFVLACKDHKVPVTSVVEGFEKAIQHAVDYKAIFHSMQDKWHESQDELVKRSKLITRLRARIQDLESQLGIDTDL